MGPESGITLLINRPVLGELDDSHTVLGDIKPGLIVLVTIKPFDRIGSNQII